MSEPLFFPSAEKVPLAEIVACTGSTAAPGADLSLMISGAAPASEAGPGDVTFLDDPEKAGFLEGSFAAACFVTPEGAHRIPASTVALVMDEPYRGFVLAMHRLFPQAAVPKSLLGTAGINPGASIHSEARLEHGVIVDPGAVIGPHAEIGSGSIIGANSVIGANVRIGRHCLIGPHVTISHTLMGDRVIVHPGARIGQTAVETRHPSLAPAPAPSTGRVIIQDGAEIGANATLDRGISGDTVIGEETRIGNLARIAENAAIGRHCMIAAKAHLPPGIRLEDYASESGEEAERSCKGR